MTSVKEEMLGDKYQRAALARSENLPSWIFDILKEDSDAVVRCDLANGKRSLEELKILVDDPKESVRICVYSNKAYPESSKIGRIKTNHPDGDIIIAYDLLKEETIRKLASHPTKQVVLKVATNTTHGSILEELADKSNHIEVLNAIALNKNVTAYGFNLLLEKASPLVLAGSCKITTEAVYKLSKIKNEEIVVTLAENPKVHESKTLTEIILKSANASDRVFRALASSKM